jgi:hypothetical protein
VDWQQKNAQAAGNAAASVASLWRLGGPGDSPDVFAAIAIVASNTVLHITGMPER